MKVEEDLAQLLSNQEWRLDNLYWIYDKSGKLVNFRMNWAQRKLLKSKHRRKNILKARQLGMSTFIAILMLDACLFAGDHPQNCAVIDKKQDQGNKKLRKIEVAYNNLDRAEDDSPHAQAVAQIGKLLKGAVKLDPKETILKFSNGSVIEAGVSMRGDTLQWLHISELGYTAVHHPQRAQEIVTGTLQGAGESCHVFLESTHEGGRTGWNYDLLKAAMSLQGQELLPEEDEFYFFSWWQHPEYLFRGGKPRLTAQLVEYFTELEKRGIYLDDERKAWYCAKCAKLTLGLMKQEYPSTPEEAFDTVIKGAIFAKAVGLAEAEGRLNRHVVLDVRAPLYVSMDIGMTDNYSLWLMQPRLDGYDYALEYYSSNGQVVGHYIDKIREWERNYRQLVTCCFLPHDAQRRDMFKERSTFATEFGKSGLPYKVLPRISRLWDGVNLAREQFNMTIFSERVDIPMSEFGGEGLSGMNCLRNYRTHEVLESGAIKTEPVHDECSHGADGFRYWAEARSRGFVGRKQESFPARAGGARLGKSSF
ncbi:MAG: hypothetical protein R3Y56_07565 [Akkermansia sp.]